jgi:hypothetical protein
MHDFTDANDRERCYRQATERLDPLPNVHIVKKFSMDALEDFEDESLDFVYIDANHEWPYVTNDIYYWSQKVRSGGIVSGHDYLKTQREDGLVQVKEAVHGYTATPKLSISIRGSLWINAPRKGRGHSFG